MPESLISVVTSFVTIVGMLSGSIAVAMTLSLFFLPHPESMPEIMAMAITMLKRLRIRFPV